MGCLCKAFFSFFFFFSMYSACFAADQKDFFDWRVVCSKEDASSHCQLTQSKALKNKGASVLLFSISTDEKRRAHYGVLSVPLGVYMAPGILVKVDNKRPFKVLYEVCDRNSCHAGFKLSSAILNALKKGNEAQVFVYTAKAKAAVFKVSLRGFSKAYGYYRAKVKG